MSDADWLAAADPEKMLKQLAKLKRPLSPRKLRLFCVACSRLIFDLMEEICRRGVEMAEKFADGEVTAEEMAAARDVGVRRHRRRFDIHAIGPALSNPDKMKQLGMARWSWEATEATTRPGKPVPGKVIQAVNIGLRVVSGQSRAGTTAAPELAGLLRDIAGNPYRTPLLDASWKTENVVALAQTIYLQRSFDRMPILADALEDAGCTSADVLEHCRGPGLHARGCWVVDLLLRKE